ncbi:MAG: LysR family transcriptional regulator [Oscillospiraceae bacterium]
MELTQLKYFLTAVNCGQIVQAAEMLHVSQSAVSMAISRLEKELGVALFEKKGRGIQLTSNGSLFVEMITPAIAELDFAQKQMLIAEKKEPDTILLSVEMPDFATTLERIYLKMKPNVRFRQAMDNTKTAEKKLLTEKVDFCLSYEPIKSPEITTIHVLTEPVLVQLRADHPLAERKQLSLSELSETPFVSFAPDYSFRRWSDGMCFLAGFRPNVIFEACETQSLVTMVRFHGAAALIPQSAQYMNETLEEPGTAEESIKTIPLVDTFCVRHAHLSYHKNRILSEDAKAFLAFVLQFKSAMELFNSVGLAEEFLLSDSDYTAQSIV